MHNSAVNSPVKSVVRSQTSVNFLSISIVASAVLFEGVMKQPRTTNLGPAVKIFLLKRSLFLFKPGGGRGDKEAVLSCCMYSQTWISAQIAY